MPQIGSIARNVQNNFIAGLKTEYTALNFPENAATDCSNIDFSLIGDITRRGGIDYEANGIVNNTFVTTNVAINTYKWNNVGGDGLTQIVVTQTGGTLNFFLSSNATTSNPLSTTKISSSVLLSTFTATGGSLDVTKECQFADGNGYLFVFHPNCDPFYCTFNSVTNTVTATLITINIRDFVGVNDGLSLTTRPLTLSSEHAYNLVNQGWGTSWTAISTTAEQLTTGSHTFTIDSSTLPVVIGSIVTATGLGSSTPVSLTGSVTSYAGTSLTINVTTVVQGNLSSWSNWAIAPQAQINSWNVLQKNYPSNADVWWLFKDSSGNFNPTNNVLSNTSVGISQASQGSIILSAFRQDRSAISGITGLTAISTVVRPRTGTWFQGRIWYAGVDASTPATGDAAYTTWTENIYFSQVITNAKEFGNCHQANDPTSESFFDLLPSDGGVIVIQGSGSIYKLFPVQNGLLVFAANGIWFITGSQGIGFAANDYTITKISGIQSISGTSFVNVLGWPYFWNSEGIYTVEPSQQGGGLQVMNMTVGNILSFYNDIPDKSKQYARGDYNSIDYQLQWCYRSTPEAGISNRYHFDSLLVHNTVEIRKDIGKAFYPYAIETGNYPTLNGVLFVQNPQGGITSPEPIFKYLVSSTQGLTFAEENNFSTYTDWKTFDGVGVDATAYVITGYNLKPQHHPYYGYFSQAIVQHSPSYIYVFVCNSADNAFLFSSIWDWAISGDSGKFSSEQLVTNSLTSTKFSSLARRLRVRGRGFSLQFKFQSVAGKPMDIVGWSVYETLMGSP